MEQLLFYLSLMVLTLTRASPPSFRPLDNTGTGNNDSAHAFSTGEQKKGGQYYNYSTPEGYREGRHGFNEGLGDIHINYHIHETIWSDDDVRRLPKKRYGCKISGCKEGYFCGAGSCHPKQCVGSGSRCRLSDKCCTSGQNCISGTCKGCYPLMNRFNQGICSLNSDCCTGYCKKGDCSPPESGCISAGSGCETSPNGCCTGLECGSKLGDGIATKTCQYKKNVPW